jgi:hypothetical protein
VKNVAAEGRHGVELSGFWPLQLQGHGCLRRGSIHLTVGGQKREVPEKDGKKGKTMSVEQRKLAIVTSLGKRYSGMIDIPNTSLRTTDLLNSANIFWRNPNEKCYDNAILLYDAKLYVDNVFLYKEFDRIQILLSEIIYFYDDFQSIGDEKEKARASRIIQQIQEEAQTVNIITKAVSNSFYHITGSFYGLFKKKSNDKFFPLTQANIVEVYKQQDKWSKKVIGLPHTFIGVSNQHIEAMTIG